MPKFLLFLLLGWSSSQMAFSDDQPVAGQKITFSRDVPQNVARSLPRKTRRLFWGAWVPQTGSPTLGVQLYESRDNLILELWEKKQKTFARINRFTYLASSSQDAKFGLDFYWLDGTHNTTPILVLTRITYENLMPGEYRLIAVMPFASGGKSKPTIQMFGDGDSNAGAEGIELQRDEKGMMELSIWSFGNSQVSETDIYDWDGKQFSLVPEKTKTVYPTDN